MNSQDNVFLRTYEADERMAGLSAAVDAAKSHDERRELWLQAIDCPQFQQDFRDLFGEIGERGCACTAYEVCGHHRKHA